ncbi:IDEAL domain-containing protein [Bacillus lacus]|uniref:IDEAL domain-containing protein n=1 Tax=Metabacillus lacus TaxID=1983721 RepID=A0A7X2M107_9BACI|nr:IDEAL domain-containing protein [Metabacillus lacus]MRX73534.1 IDEAL domain-containing protein [Metabacillus lacus]
MNNKKSYNEILKSRNNQKQQELKETSILDVYIQMILDEAMFSRKLLLLETQINEALDKNDKESFMELSVQYNRLKLAL